MFGLSKRNNKLPLTVSLSLDDGKTGTLAMVDPEKAMTTSCIYMALYVLPIGNDVIERVLGKIAISAQEIILMASANDFKQLEAKAKRFAGLAESFGGRTDVSKATAHAASFAFSCLKTFANAADNKLRGRYSGTVIQQCLFQMLVAVSHTDAAHEEVARAYITEVQNHLLQGRKVPPVKFFEMPEWRSF